MTRLLCPRWGRTPPHTHLMISLGASASVLSLLMPTSSMLTFTLANSAWPSTCKEDTTTKGCGGFALTRTPGFYVGESLGIHPWDPSPRKWGSEDPVQLTVPNARALADSERTEVGRLLHLPGNVLARHSLLDICAQGGQHFHSSVVRPSDACLSSAALPLSRILYPEIRPAGWDHLPMFGAERGRVRRAGGDGGVVARSVSAAARRGLGR